jgi:sigma-B regulation protein RsbU (phosphoserine phosphatase)
LNKAFCKEHFPGSPFLTIFFCFLDLSTDTLTYSLAGHHPCILYNNETGKLSTFGHSGKPIGVFEEQEYKDASISLGVQDNVFLFTDGLTEVFNKEGVKVFDAKSLVKFLSERAKMSESGTIKALVQHLKDLRGQSSFEDDIAILNIKREK